MEESSIHRQENPCFSNGKSAQAILTNPHSVQFRQSQTHGRDHPPDLPVFPLVDHHPKHISVPPRMTRFDPCGLRPFSATDSDTTSLSS